MFPVGIKDGAEKKVRGEAGDSRAWEGLGLKEACRSWEQLVNSSKGMERGVFHPHGENYAWYLEGFCPHTYKGMWPCLHFDFCLLRLWAEKSARPIQLLVYRTDVIMCVVLSQWFCASHPITGYGALWDLVLGYTCKSISHPSSPAHLPRLHETGEPCLPHPSHPVPPALTAPPLLSPSLYFGGTAPPSGWWQPF